MNHSHVLVTGGSGFIAGHCILQLLEQGCFVRTTLRSLDKEAAVRSALEDAGMVHSDRLSFTAANLDDDTGWTEAVCDVRFVLHVASPVRPGVVRDENEVIAPAREGTLRVLRAARDAGVKRVVLTSAFHAVGWGHPRRSHAFTESDWTNVDGPGVDAYGKSKTLAERAAWDFVSGDGRAIELTTLLPVAVMGPVLGRDVTGSNHLIQLMLTGKMRALPDLHVPIVDVRDVAKAHVQAMTEPRAAGERFLLSSGRALALKEIASILRAELGDAAARVPTRSAPNLVLRMASLFNRTVRGIVPDLGYAKQTSNAKARSVLDWTPRDSTEAIVAAARSMMRKGLIDA
ncbi:MAG: epimerase [Rhodanobacter denitrificans]|uniref:Epimerase n=1 Tax=Rhodanobacter denitrificans TaxID=666685 RepID=A0A2W5MEM5_9GAMM|nr:MAG: epimerase [Rhodanobacter denitrificans]